MSSWNRNHGLLESQGFTGQNGRESPRSTAAHTTARPASAWADASATRGCRRRRDIADPTLLPIPRPARNTARMIEKV
jgi:hypothetical protein